MLCLRVLLTHSTNVVELTELARNLRDILRVETLQRLELSHLLCFSDT